MDYPSVTIVTVVYNAVDLIEETIQSVINQDYPNLEYIVIDGASNDGTLDIIKKYSSKIDYIMSEKDKGIYDAMNKGIHHATGKYINFMNAGDLFKNYQTVLDVFKIAPEKADMIYGHQEIRYDSFIKKRKTKPLEDLWKWTIFNHQSLFARTELLKKEPFRMDYPIAADYYHFYSQYKRGSVFFNTDLYICNSMPGGVSDIQAIKGYREVWEIVNKWDNNFKINWHHRSLILKQTIIMWIRKLLPSVLFEKLMKIKNQMLTS